MKKLNILKRIKIKNDPDIKEKFFVFDVETTKLSPKPENFVFGVIYGHNYKKVIFSIEDFRDEFKDERYKGKYIFAHNAEFDLSALFGNIYKNVDNQAIFNGKFILAKHDNNITFVDSLNVLPMALAKIGEAIGLNKLDNEKVKGQKLTKENISREDIEYCIRDCKVIFDALYRAFKKAGTIKITVASLAMHSFLSRFLKFDIAYDVDLVNEFFDSYYGGRTEVIKLGLIDNAKCYDVNSLYPFAMKHCVFPDVRNLKKETKLDLKYFEYLLKNYEGCTKVTVLHDDYHFGMLPFRCKKTKKLLFPVGTFETTVNFNELRFAIGTGKVKILNCEYAIYSNPVESPFIEYVDHWFEEKKTGKTDFDILFAKLMLNALYGKFATKLKYLFTYYDEIPLDLIDELQEMDKFYSLHIFNQQRTDCFLETENDKKQNTHFTIPAFSSYITSFARIKLLSSLIDNIGNDICYMDTDSIMLTGDFIGSVSNELGDWKKESKIITAVYGLKNYRSIENGEHKTIIKGVSKNAKKIGHNEYKVTQYFKTKESLRRNKDAGDLKEVIKKISNKYDKREIIDNGNTKPIKL